MKTFISWSGDYSKEVASLFYKWIKNVIQASDPFISLSNIEPGSKWFDKISDELKTSVGVICLTKSNKNNPWILYEAGALSKSIDDAESRVCPLLIDLMPKDVEPPLSQFHMISTNRDDMLKLVQLINARLDKDRQIKEFDIEYAFNKWWSDFEQGLKDIAINHPENPNEPERTEESVLSEILQNTRSLSQALRTLENLSLEERQRKYRNERVHINYVQGPTKYVRVLEGQIAELMGQGVAEDEIFHRLKGGDYPDQLIYEVLSQRFGHPVQ